ncbi:hypothetical protein [Caldicellulosiruptor naganoensis]|uniref:Uncharacterized protein n=1 Tax=Caldicellulosiruptor naganoensis TaxID=29324 RepID=A0ABY7BK95_9FIRM|nr:hypothetical protein [Caldicellulosiruptor naganoensis]WAM32001.1 hypothetical protein OTJ99_000491 [Caldicellulosiruptor naganoensis]
MPFYNGLAFLVEFRTKMLNFKEEIPAFKDDAKKKIEDLIEMGKATKQLYGEHEVDIKILKQKIGMVV